MNQKTPIAWVDLRWNRALENHLNHIILFHVHHHLHLICLWRSHSSRTVCTPTSSSHTGGKSRRTKQKTSLHNYCIPDYLTSSLYASSQGFNCPDTGGSIVLGILFRRTSNSFFHHTYFSKCLDMVDGYNWYRKTLSKIPRICQPKRGDMVTHRSRCCTWASIFEL